MKYQIKLLQNLPYAACPTLVELEGEKIICNDVCLPKSIDITSYNPHNIRGWVIGHEFGPICMIFASHEQDAFDAAVDTNMLECLLVDDQENLSEEERGEYAPLGNASELHDLTHAWIGEVEYEPARDIHLIVALIRAMENSTDTL